MLVDRAYMPPPFGRRPGGIATRVSFSATGQGDNCFGGISLEGNVADIVYLVRLADVAGVDVDIEAVAKLARDESHYPAD